MNRRVRGSPRTINDKREVESMSISKRSIFAPPTAKQADTALLIIRVVAGVILAAHGGQKVFQFGMATVGQNFGQMGIPMAAVMGPFISLLELVGGVALVAGLLTRLVALGLFFDMLGAILMVHMKGGFFAPNGIEFVLMLAAACASLVIAGAGMYSVDGAIAKKSGTVA